MCYTMGMTESRLTAISNTALAFMGDAVHSFYVRNALIEKHDFKSAELAKREAAFVSAVAAADRRRSFGGAARTEHKDEQ